MIVCLNHTNKCNSDPKKTIWHIFNENQLYDKFDFMFWHGSSNIKGASLFLHFFICVKCFILFDHYHRKKFSIRLNIWHILKDTNAKLIIFIQMRSIDLLEIILWTRRRLFTSKRYMWCSISHWYCICTKIVKWYR